MSPMFPFEKNRFIILALFLGALLLYVRYIDPLVQLVDELFLFYSPVFDGEAPNLVLQNKQITFIGDLPKTITLESGAVVSFGYEPHDSLLNAAPPGSIFFSPKSVSIKTAHKTRTFDLQTVNIEKENLVVDFFKLGLWLHRSIFWLKLATAFAFSAAAFIILALLDLFFGAVGLVIDAFRNGPYSFRYYLGYAALYLFVTSSLTCIFNLAFGPARVVFVLSFMTYIVAVNFKIRDALRAQQAAL